MWYNYLVRWSHNLAYVIGLLVTDGNLSKDGRHIDLTSKDLDQIKIFIKLLGLNNKIGFKKSSYNPKGTYYRVQFGSVSLYKFLLRVGLMPNKTKLIGPLKVPDKYFADFLRGHLDGDGYTYSFWDKRWKNSFRIYTAFTSASKSHLEWIREKIRQLYHLEGAFRYKGKSTFELSFSKRTSLIILKNMYHEGGLPCLCRKYSKIKRALDIING